MWHAKRPRRRKRKKRRRLPSACGKRSVNERGLLVSEGLAQTLQGGLAKEHGKRSGRTRAQVNEDPAQAKAADQKILQYKHADRHGKRSARRRAPVNEDHAQAKEDDQLTVRRCRSRSLRRGGSIRWGYCNQLGC